MGVILIDQSEFDQWTLDSVSLMQCVVCHGKGMRISIYIWKCYLPVGGAHPQLNISYRVSSIDIIIPDISWCIIYHLSIDVIYPLVYSKCIHIYVYIYQYNETCINVHWAHFCQSPIQLELIWAEFAVDLPASALSGAWHARRQTTPKLQTKRWNHGGNIYWEEKKRQIPNKEEEKT